MEDEGVACYSSRKILYVKKGREPGTPQNRVKKGISFQELKTGGGRGTRGGEKKMRTSDNQRVDSRPS